MKLIICSIGSRSFGFYRRLLEGNFESKRISNADSFYSKKHRKKLDYLKNCTPIEKPHCASASSISAEVVVKSDKKFYSVSCIV